MKRDASKFVEAWNSKDNEGLVDLLSDRSAAKGSDGRDAVRKGIKGVYDYLKYLGFESVHVSLGEPTPPKRFGDLYASFVPILAIADGPEAKVTWPSNLLGVSSDYGKSWKFVVLLKVEQKQIDSMFPEFEKKLLIPTSSNVPAKFEQKAAANGTKKAIGP